MISLTLGGISTYEGCGKKYKCSYSCHGFHFWAYCLLYKCCEWILVVLSFFLSRSPFLSLLDNRSPFRTDPGWDHCSARWPFPNDDCTYANESPKWTAVKFFNFILQSQCQIKTCGSSTTHFPSNQTKKQWLLANQNRGFSIGFSKSISGKYTLMGHWLIRWIVHVSFIIHLFPSHPNIFNLNSFRVRMWV